jgi:hypothetical protein
MAIRVCCFTTANPFLVWPRIKIKDLPVPRNLFMKNKKALSTQFTTFLCSAVLLAIPSISTATSTVSVGTGFDFSSGDYGGSTTTDFLYIPVDVKYKQDMFALKLTIPYVSTSNDGGNVIISGSSVLAVESDGTESETDNTESGLGDIIFYGTYFLYEGSEEQPLFPMIDLTGKIKFPTADETKGLGTGEIDYSIETDLTWVTGQTALFGTVGYRIQGNPDEYELSNVFYGGVGFAYQVDYNLSGGLMYDIKEASFDNGSGISEATLYMNYKFNEAVKTLVYAYKGFSDGSPDYGVGLTLTYSMGADDIDWMAPIRRISNF